MEARHRWTAKTAVGIACLIIGSAATGLQAAGHRTAGYRTAGYRTTNFEVAAPTPELAREIGDAAERFRHDLAVEWLGKEMPSWSKRCPIKASVSPKLGAGGATSFLFDRGEVYGWRMEIQGSRERILDSVLPHEVTHTIFASHFRQPLPRWADEGACTTVEHKSEIAKQEKMLITFLHTKRAIPFSQMMTMKEYPNDIMPLYSQGHSVTHYLVQRRGKQAFLAFLADGMEDENWPRVVREHYGYKNLLAMQNDWLGWVKQDCPAVPPDADAPTASSALTDARAAGPSTRLVAVSARPHRPTPNVLFRGEEIAPEGDQPAKARPPEQRNSRPKGVVLHWSRAKSRGGETVLR